MYSKKLFHNRKRLHSSWVYNQEDINKVLYNVPLITIKDYIPLRDGKMEIIWEDVLFVNH